MKKLISSLALSLMLPALPVAAEEAPESVKSLAQQLASWGNDQTLIEAVKAQNAKGMSLEAIKARDAEWRKVEGFDAEMKAMMESKVAKKLFEFEKSQAYFFELFLMDNQGANVAMTNKTSDYWQGDEAKWQESFKGGSGAIHIGDVEFDESAQDYLVQVSIPVMEAGKAVGALTIGINIDTLEGE